MTRAPVTRSRFAVAWADDHATHVEVIEAPSFRAAARRAVREIAHEKGGLVLEVRPASAADLAADGHVMAVRRALRWPGPHGVGVPPPRPRRKVPTP